MAHKTTFLAGLIFLLSSLLFAQGEFHGPVYIIGDDGRLYIDHIPDTITASYLAVIDDGWLKKLDIDNLELDTSNITGLYDYLNSKSDTGHVHDTSDVNNLSLYLGQKLDIADTSDLARKVHVHDTSDVTGLHSMLAGKEPSLGFGDNMSTLRGSDKTWAPVTSMLSLNPPNAPDQYYKHNGLTFVWSNIAISDVTNLQDALELKLDVTELDAYYTKTNLQTSGQSQVHWGNVINAPSFITGVNWDDIGSKPTVFPPESHNHSASDINSGTLSDSRLSFNPDYFVQGETIRRSCSYGASNPLDNNNVSAFYSLSAEDPSNPLSVTAYGIHINSATANGYGFDIIGRGDQNKILWSGIDGGTRQPWREIWHSGNLDPSNYALVSHNHDTRYPLKSLGRVGTARTIKEIESGRNVFDDGMYTYSWFNPENPPDGLPPYGSAVTFGGTRVIDGRAQLLAGWASDGENYLAFRSLRDVTNDWYSLKRIYHEGYKPQWDDVGSKPTVFPPESHNHDASDITSGTLSNDRLSFNPDYFVQGTDSRRSDDYDENNPLDNNFKSGFFYLRTTDPANTLGSHMHGIRSQMAGSDNYSLEILGRANLNKLYFGGISAGIRHPWREIWHGGNLDTANIARRNADNVFTGVNTFSDTVGIKNGIKISDNSNHFFMIGPDLNGEAGNELPSIKFYLKDYSSGYPNTSEQSLKFEADWIRNYADYRISNSAERISNSGLSTFSNYNISSRVTNPVHIRNDHSYDSTGAQITFGFDHSITSDWHHAGIKAMRTNKGADHASSIYLQARTPGTSSGPSGLTDIVEAGINDHQAFVKYHNNPPVIHSEFENIGFDDLTLNPTKGVYICVGRVNYQEITLGTDGVENGQTVKILKASDLLAGVRYGAPNNYYWRSIGHFGAAEFIHYHGVWFCHGAEYIP